MIPNTKISQDHYIGSVCKLAMESFNCERACKALLACDYEWPKEEDGITPDTVYKHGYNLAVRACEGVMDDKDLVQSVRVRGGLVARATYIPNDDIPLCVTIECVPVWSTNYE